MYIGADVVRVESLLARKTRFFPLSTQIDVFKIMAFELINASTQNGNRVVVLRWPSWLSRGNRFGQFAFFHTIHPRRLDRANHVCLICAVIFFADFFSGKGGGVPMATKTASNSKQLIGYTRLYQASGHFKE